MNQEWDARKYTQSFSFVPRYGQDVASLLDWDKIDTLLDLGCGNGDLTAQLARRGWTRRVRPILNYRLYRGMRQISRWRHQWMPYFPTPSCIGLMRIVSRQPCAVSIDPCVRLDSWFLKWAAMAAISLFMALYGMPSPNVAKRMSGRNISRRSANMLPCWSKLVFVLSMLHCSTVLQNYRESTAYRIGFVCLSVQLSQG